jgi:hypothetical protein
MVNIKAQILQARLNYLLGETRPNLQDRHTQKCVIQMVVGINQYDTKNKKRNVIKLVEVSSWST